MLKINQIEKKNFKNLSREKIVKGKEKTWKKLWRVCETCSKLPLVIQTFGLKPLTFKGVIWLADFWKQLTFELFSK